MFRSVFRSLFRSAAISYTLEDIEDLDCMLQNLGYPRKGRYEPEDFLAYNVRTCVRKPKADFYRELKKTALWYQGLTGSCEISRYHKILFCPLRDVCVCMDQVHLLFLISWRLKRGK